MYKIVTASSASALETRVNLLIVEGYVPAGSHVVVETHRQNRFSGLQLKDTVVDREYSQTMVKP